MVKLTPLNPLGLKFFGVIWMDDRSLSEKWKLFSDCGCLVNVWFSSLSVRISFIFLVRSFFMSSFVAGESRSIVI